MWAWCRSSTTSIRTSPSRRTWWCTAATSVFRKRNYDREFPRCSNLPGSLDAATAKIMTLSGGMKRRLTLARALVNNPQLVFMDEPTTGLDPQARHLIWERLRSLTQEGKTLVLTTHFMEEAERLCHRLAIMDRGRIIAQGTPRALIAEHIEPQVLEVHGHGLRSLDGAREDPGAARRAGGRHGVLLRRGHRAAAEIALRLSRI